MDASTLYAQIESAKTKETLALAVKHMSKLTESERRSLAELVAQRQAEFSTESHIDMNPELVTREAVDAALIAIQTYAHNPSERAKVEIALATALPMLLGNPVAWMAENGDVMSARSRSTCTRASSLNRYRIPLVRADGVATTNGDETA